MLFFLVVSSSSLFSQGLSQGKRVFYRGDMLFRPGAGIDAGVNLGTAGSFSFPLHFELGIALHPRNSLRLFFTAGPGVTYENSKGFLIMFDAGIGYQHTFSASPVYTRNTDGLVYKTYDKGRSQFLFNTKLLTGARLKSSPEWYWFSGPEYSLEYPYNANSLSRVSLLIGAGYAK